MKTLKDYINKTSKEKLYAFYKKLIKKPKNYESITRNDMYDDIISLYKEDPEIILKLCTIEEIEILKSLLLENKTLDDVGYIEYIMYQNLKDNFLILDDTETNAQYIPEDLVNLIKMAINLYNEEVYSFKDITDSVIIGLIKIHNVMKLEEFATIIPRYYVRMTKETLKAYINESPKLKNKIAIIKYKKEEYVISLEYEYYKDVLALKKDSFRYKEYNLEAVISIGKYKMNLFKEEIFEFLSFLELHLHPKYIVNIIDEIVIYDGFDMNNEDTLKKIADNIDELYEEIKKVINFFPVWIYNGNDLESLQENLILPDKNDPCICGSGKKFKNCCRKFYK